MDEQALTTEERAAARSDDAPPAPCVAVFNLEPGRYVHRSWLPRRPVMLRPPGIAVAPAGHHALSAWLVQAHGLDSGFDWDLRAPAKRVFLARTDWLERLQLEVGLALHREALAHAIDGDRQRQIRALPGLDAEALHFALVKAPREPAAPGPRSFDALLCTPARAALRLRREGARVLLGLLDPQWVSVRARAALRLPRGVHGAGRWAANEDDRHRWARYVFAELIPGRFEPWLWLC